MRQESQGPSTPGDRAVQKFTRPLTREIELGSERLAVTFSAEGLSLRPVGTRKPPREITWPALVCLLAGPQASAGQPSAEVLAAAVNALKKGAAPAPKTPT